MCVAEHQRPPIKSREEMIKEGWILKCKECGSYDCKGKHSPKIKYVSYGTANRFEGHIEIHEKLKLYPNLHDFIVEHELKHDKTE